MEINQKPVLHVVFAMSAAATIRQALGQLGCEDRVIGLPDDLSLGPICVTDATVRARWIEDNLGYDWDEVVGLTDLFWAEATSPRACPVAWVCRNHAGEYAGFLEFLRRMANRPVHVIDASDVRLPQWHRPARSKLWSLGVLDPAQIVEAGLLQRQATLSATERARFEQRGQQLRTENAPLRVIDERGLVSAPITHFDEALASLATSEWRQAAHLIGETMADLLERPFAQCPCDIFLWSRVLALGAAETIDVRGSGPDMRGHHVRRAR